VPQPDLGKSSSEIRASTYRHHDASLTQKRPVASVLLPQDTFSGGQNCTARARDDEARQALVCRDIHDAEFTQYIQGRLTWLRRLTWVCVSTGIRVMIWWQATVCFSRRAGLGVGPARVVPRTAAGVFRRRVMEKLRLALRGTGKGPRFISPTAEGAGVRGNRPPGPASRASANPEIKIHYAARRTIPGLPTGRR